MSKQSWLMTVCMVLFMAAGTASAVDPNVQWGVQFGSAGDDSSYDATVDPSGNVFIAGATDGALFAADPFVEDIYVARYALDGSLLWGQQIGSSTTSEVAGNCATDAAGNCYAAGSVESAVGGTALGAYDALACKFLSDGTVAWMRQFGTSSVDKARGIGSDLAGNVYVTGYTEGDLAATNQGNEDVFLAKYDSAGSLLWTRQFGSTGSDLGEDLCLDAAGNCYIVGRTNGDTGDGSHGYDDGFIAKYDKDGNLQWVRQHGASQYDQFYDVVVAESGNIYIGGSSNTFGGPDAGQGDTIIVKCDPAGDVAWIQKFGTGNWDGANAVALPTDGEEGVLFGICGNWPNCEATAGRLDPNGDLVWSLCIPEGAYCGRGIGMDSSGDCYLVGNVTGDLYGANAGEHDVAITKIAVPEPATAVLLAAGCLGVIRRRRPARLAARLTKPATGLSDAGRTGDVSPVSPCHASPRV